MGGKPPHAILRRGLSLIAVLAAMACAGGHRDEWRATKQPALAEAAIREWATPVIEGPWRYWSRKAVGYAVGHSSDPSLLLSLRSSPFIAKASWQYEPGWHSWLMGLAAVSHQVSVGGQTIPPGHYALWLEGPGHSVTSPSDALVFRGHESEEIRVALPVAVALKDEKLRLRCTNLDGQVALWLGSDVSLRVGEW